uniref:hypothetical protein n=1 Tax=Neorhizobium sp. EC2-8 TaxID=3129230 RepID=UPI003100E395
MRTPWRFVADLVSRKPKTHGHDESPAVIPKTTALEYKPVPDEEPPGLGGTAVEASSVSGSEVQVEASLLEPDTGPTDAVAPAPVAEAPAPTPTQAAETLVKPAPAPRKKVEPIIEPVASIGTTFEEAPAVAAGPKSFVDEMTDLDAEVDALRHQLAKKLIEQNAQLRKMLARFDAR